MCIRDSAGVAQGRVGAVGGAFRRSRAGQRLAGRREARRPPAHPEGQFRAVREGVGHPDVVAVLGGLLRIFAGPFPPQ
eukprot:8141919-Alexandrium_andersonii.AAC.1